MPLSEKNAEKNKQDRQCAFDMKERSRDHCRRGKAVSIRDQLKCDGTRAETRFRLSAKRRSPFKSVGGRLFSRLLAAKVCASAVVMLIHHVPR